MNSVTLTPGPNSVEKAIWARNGFLNRTFQLPCTGPLLENRDGQRDDASPFTCGSYPRRAVIKHFLRKTYGGSDKYNEGARLAVVHRVQTLINSTMLAWGIKQNFLCTCLDGITTGWKCCTEQKNCAVEACPCSGGGVSVACCTSVCQGLNGNGLMKPFSSLPGTELSRELLTSMGTYLRNDVWVSNDPWLLFDPMGKESYASSWNQSQFQVADAGLFDASKPVVYYDEITYPFKSTFWEHCTGLLQQVIWTMPMNRKNDKPKGMGLPYDLMNGKSMSVNLTYTEDFIQSLTLEAYKSSPVYWHYNVRHTPSQSEMCKRTAPRKPNTSSYFKVDQNNLARQFGFSSMTLGGLGGADCFCGWWDTLSTCKIPDTLCSALVQILGFTRICVSQRQIYNVSDHLTVLASLESLLVQQPGTAIPCPLLQVSEHWGFINQSNGLPWTNVTNMILTEGISGFRVGNVNGLFAAQNLIMAKSTRIEQAETSTVNVALQCNGNNNPAAADLFIDDLFPSAQGVRQSMPQSYCTRFGIELARLSVYNTAGLTDAVGQQQPVVDKWRVRCQYKLEELAVCNSYRVYDATGGPTDTSQCPFTLSVSTMLHSSYAVTPGCLVVLWNTNGQNGIYDPCICVPCSSTPVIDVPNMLTTLCLMASLQSLVAKDVIPGESAVPLGSGSFESLMHKPGYLQINTPDITHWALHTGIRDADLIADWWPDQWRYPTGYHVTAGCSRQRDAHWKTFDASWRWDSQSEQMIFSKDETNDPLLSRNSFGASGVCRANNYGMPMTGLNTMTACTKENVNAKVDPTVPAQPKQPQWSDGQENCAPDAFSTPWNVNRVLNPPRQWSVGTLQQDVLAPLIATEWGDSCGPYPLQTCNIDNDCASGFSCILVKGAGVCGKKQTGKFMCTNHAQCNDDQMCAGDGICVSGVWQVENDISMPISFRTYSQNCLTGVSLDTWGTSIAENVPDILTSSGLCSYRSWFENRRMASRNFCNNSDTCSSVDGNQPWNFTSPYMSKAAGESAFDSDVLKVQTHPCDRDYQYLQGFVSCTPDDAYLKMYDQYGNALDGYTTSKDKRTWTYRTGYTIPLIHHVDEMTGPTFGFTGVPKTYSDLFGQSKPSIIACSEEKICSLQPANSFKVNGIIVDVRQVLASGIQRIYSINDLLACGVFGYVIASGNCRLDYAIVPLAYLVINKLLPGVTTVNGLSDLYQPDSKSAMLSILQGLPELIIKQYVGGRPNMLQDYIQMSDKFVSLYSLFSVIDQPAYETAGIPMQIYNMTLFGALEVPFAWWYKCVWLNNIPMGSNVIDETKCWWNLPGNGSKPTNFGPIDSRLAALFKISTQSPQTSQITGLLDALVRLPGILTQSILDQAKTDYTTQRNNWIDKTKTVLLDNIWKKCYQQKAYIKTYSDNSQDYQLQRLAQMTGASLFDTNRVYRNDATNVTLCSGLSCLLSTGYAQQLSSGGTFIPSMASNLASAEVTTNNLPLTGTKIQDVPDEIALGTLFSSSSVFDTVSIITSNLFSNIPDGCSSFVTAIMRNPPSLSCLCSKATDCGSQILAMVLKLTGVSTQPSPSTPANLVLGNVKLDVCESLDTTSLGTCYFNNGIISPGVQFPSVTSVSIAPGTTAEIYQELNWQCVQLACTGRDTAINGKKYPSGYLPTQYTTTETVVMDIYEYTQTISGIKTNAWGSLAEQITDISCTGNTHRFDYRDGDCSFDYSRGAYRCSCTPSCNINTRQVPASYVSRLRVQNISYFNNGVLVAQIESYPCIVSIDYQSDPSSSILINTPDFTDAAFLFSDNFRDDKDKGHLSLCSNIYDDSTGLPKNSSLNDAGIRFYNSERYSQANNAHIDVLTSIQRVLSTLKTQNQGSNCLQNALYLTSELADKTRLTCKSSDTVSVGSVSVYTWSPSPSDVSMRAAYCNRLKSDPFFGCIMYPGELTVQATHDVTNYIANSNEAWTPCTTNDLAYNSCIQNDQSDACKSIPDPLNNVRRNMLLTGATVTYTLITTAPDCTVSAPQQCSLVDELSDITTVSQLALCPGTNPQTQRFQDYAKLNGNPVTRIKTGMVTPFTVLTGDPISRSTYSNPNGFSHMFLGLSPGYQCCKGCQNNAPPQCPIPSQIAIQMRSSLWLCANCPMVSDVQCIGVHNCLMSSPNILVDLLITLDGWNSTTPQQQAYLINTDSTIDIAVSAVQWLIKTLSALWIPDVRLSYVVPAFMTSFNNNVPYVYNPLPILQYDITMQINSQTCLISGLVSDLTKCNYDSHRLNLRKFISRNYKTDEGTVIQPRQTLQWKMRRSQLVMQNIPYWEANISKRGGMFMTDLLDDKWCLKGSTVGSACYRWFDNQNKMHLDVLNPSLLGVFEPSIGCDTAIVNQQRVVSSVCSDCFPSEYVTAENGFQIPCSQTSDAVQRVTVDNAAATNLCSKTPTIDTSCSNQHGMLGQTTYDSNPVSDTYTRQQWKDSLPTGVSSNPLFQGGAAPKGISNLVLSSYDIGGHFVKMVMSQTRGGAYAMSIQGLPLSSYPDPLGPIAYALGTSGSDMTWTQVNTAKETYALNTLYPASVCKAWDCPLRRRAFWMGLDSKFRPMVPDPLRTQILYGMRAHPTQQAFPMPSTLSQLASNVLGRYSTFNGFCACLNPPCVGCSTDTGALTGIWTQSTTLQQGQQCSEQLDWPYAGGKLRDGSSINQRWTLSTSCGVLDRLPTFQYRYKDSQVIQPTTKTTLDRGGVCHTGWPIVTSGPLMGCYILVETDTFMCPTFLGPKNVTRLRAKTIPELLNSPSRSRLTDCTTPPVYQMGNNTQTTPEVSYGQPKRWEASRLLANDLRRRLCGNSVECKPSSNWSLPTFWESIYMKNFPPIPQGNGANKSLWTKPWVACTQGSDGTQTCEGTIDRSSWATGNRPQICLDTLLAQNISKQLSQDMDVCNLDSSLDGFCRAIQNARYRVFEANCQYSGQCRQKLFFYQPSTYEVDNSEFVRSTVQTFYNSIITGACVPDQDTAAEMLKNAQNIDKCAAVQLDVMVQCIQIVRVIVGAMVELMFYAGEIVLTVFEMLGPLTVEQKTQVDTKISTLLSLIVNKFNLIFQEIGDLIYKVFTKGPMGSWIIGLIQAICAFIEWLFQKVVYVVLCWVNYTLVFVLEFYADGLVTVLNGISFGALGYLHADIANAVIAVQTNIPCSDRKMWDCNIPISRDNRTDPTLPLPTRCWAGVEPGINSLGCSAADTCLQQSDYTNVICGVCPAASSMVRFGCDTLTKLCSCNIFPVGISSCTSHQDCAIDDPDVSCRYVDSYLQPSYGNVPCVQCPKPMCLITSGLYGQCSCLLRPVPIQACSDVGMPVSPDAVSLCLVASESSNQLASSTSYTVNYGTLLSVPCMLLNRAQAYCMNVYTSATVSTPLVVGLALLQTRRRLLWDQSASNGSVFLVSNTSVWVAEGEPCRSLVLANTSDLGILEKYTLGECWRWYEIGNRLIIETNMSHAVSPFLLVSWRDLLDTMLNRGALVEIMAKFPMVVNRLLLHSEYAQPAYLLLAYWTSIIPRDVWLNQTFLDETAEFMHNASTQKQHNRRILKFNESETKKETLSHKRDLLQNTVIDTTVSSQTIYEWGQGPYAWPPNFVYWNGGDSCAVASTAIDVVKHGLDATFYFYSQSVSDPLPISWPDMPFKAAVPDLSGIQSIDTTTLETAAESMKNIMSNLAYTWIDDAIIKSFLVETPYMPVFESLIKCNFTRIQTCTDRRSLFWSVVQTTVFLIVLAIAIKALQIPYADIFLLGFAMFMFLYVTYGYSPSCVPLIPTCLLRDLFEITNWLLPVSIQWPDSLVTQPNCMSVSCMRSCSTDQIVGFASYNDHIAWIMCETNLKWAIDTALSMSMDNTIRMSILRKCILPELIPAQRICFAITLVNSMPLLILFSIALWLLPSVLGLVIAGVQFTIGMIFTLVLFVHAHE